METCYFLDSFKMVVLRCAYPSRDIDKPFVGQSKVKPYQQYENSLVSSARNVLTTQQSRVRQNGCRCNPTTLKRSTQGTHMLIWKAKTAIMPCARFFGPEGYNARRSTEYRGSNVDYLFHARTPNSRPMATIQALSCTEGPKQDHM